MELEKIKKLIQKARTSAKSEVFLSLVDCFEEFIQLYTQKDDPEQGLKLQDAHQKFWNSFEKVASQFGMTPELLKNYFDDPNNFSPKQWQNVQTIKREFDEDPVSRSKKMKKQNGKVRV